MAIITRAQQLNPGLERDSSTWNDLCGMGSLWNRAATVMSACDRAVELEPEDGRICANRGMARALTGDFTGALEDLRLFKAWLEEYESDSTEQLENLEHIIS
jgi:regulator of sirC expression with transglutaminase-like and TPR domain